MCGIAGLYDQNGGIPDHRALDRMSEAMALRGPDGEGFFHDPKGGLALAHRRLAILDPGESGAQPMSMADGRYWIVFNGEIYNHPELRLWCEAHGARYRSRSDTETLLHLYALEGEAMLARLRGMFAFALWDSVDRRLLLARDPLGIKPLYYARSGGTWAFASQVKALQAGGYGSGVSAPGLVSFLLLGYVLEPFTIDSRIQALPAGHALSLEDGAPPRIWEYRDGLAPLRRHGSSQGRSPPEFWDALRESVRLHLLSDVPVGVFLSSGLDSAAVCTAAATAEPRPELLAVTLGFEEYANRPNDEVPGAKAIAETCRIPHRVSTVRREDFLEERERIHETMDQPTIDGINTYMVSRTASRLGLKVALSGLGGDELLGGYPSFRQVPRLSSTFRFAPRWLGAGSRRVLSRVLPKRLSPKYASLIEWGRSIPEAYFLRRALFMPWELTNYLEPDFAEEGWRLLQLRERLFAIIEEIPDPYDQVMALETAIYMRNCLLRDADWAGMAHSVEIRTPFADADLHRCVLSGGSGASHRPTKDDLRHGLAKSGLDHSLLQRPKSGFSIPVASWLLEETPKKTDPLPRNGAAEHLRSWALAILRFSHPECIRQRMNA